MKYIVRLKCKGEILRDAFFNDYKTARDYALYKDSDFNKDEIDEIEILAQLQKRTPTNLWTFTKEKTSQTLEAVISDLKSREEKGVQTYGGTVDEANLSREQWLQHAYEEALDLCIYLKKLMA